MTGANEHGMILGVDIGSVSVSLVWINLDGALMQKEYLLHRGDVRNALKPFQSAFSADYLKGIAAPGGKVLLRDGIPTYDVQVSIMEACHTQKEIPRSILHVGAERFFLIEQDASGQYLQTSHSSSCAAGTGSFLDQQAVRLGLSDTSRLSEMALQNDAPIPDIAARCSVFAKTDLIHAQQKGHSLGAICDSLCKGLAENIADTLFSKSAPRSPLLMTGGVSRNQAVVSHLEELMGIEVFTPEDSHHYPALGAALLYLEDFKKGRLVERQKGRTAGRDLLPHKGNKDYFFEPLLSKAHKGDKKADVYFRFKPAVVKHADSVRVDVSKDLPSGDLRMFLGIDVGSTSTKAILLPESGPGYAGFYTYTSGQPLVAVQALFETMDQTLGDRNIHPRILAAGTTGSGRKFIRSVTGADTDVDEITAHARAAFDLNPETDTIIEIGGQDAKFTRMDRGVVTFSHMNTVCAAGTGSFIEELAGRLGVALEDIENLALGRPAPLASDRCTVFMERDINQLLSQGYSVEEVLATVIHSVRENYLKKVASEAQLGDHICFQGATAKNGALVAAFEQRLGRKLFVSPLCHLTGALGTALILREEAGSFSSFRGLGIYRQQIPVRTESCELCLNKCTISMASVNGVDQAYGFLCGRDYETKRYVKESGAGFDLIKERNRALRGLCVPVPTGKTALPSIAMPLSLHLQEDLGFWKDFFHTLGIPLHSSQGFKESVKLGKKMAGAEFCAPIDSMYGHVGHLSSQFDRIFMPVYLEARNLRPGSEENLCYYTQFSAALAYLQGEGMASKLVSPMLNFRKNGDHNARILLKSLNEAGFPGVSLSRVSRSLRLAQQGSERRRQALVDLYRTQFTESEDVSVVLLGRPYVVISEGLHKGIPDIFRKMGIPAYYQDMLDTAEGSPELERLLRKVPWYFAAHILRAAEEACRTKGLYPVLVTAFKCAPDSFILEYFKQLVSMSGKPYLILQIDEHDSNTGYETRIEAAIRSFRNHFRLAESKDRCIRTELLPAVDTRLNGKTLLMPNWDPDVGPLIVANLRRSGVDARLLESSEMSIRRSMVHNTGQCLPINIIAQDYIDYVEGHGLDPSNVILWMMESKMTCNLRQYPFYIKRILENYGEGMEKAAVYSGQLTHREMSLSVTYYAYFAYMLGGLFRKVACRIRPYEKEKGTTDRVREEVQEILQEAFEGLRSMDAAIQTGLDLFGAIDYDRSSRKPLVAIFGDLYVRDNDIMNQDLVRDIERAGGEVLMTPYHDYAKLSVENIFRRAHERGEHLETGLNRIILNVLKFMDDKHYKPFSKILGKAPVIKPRTLEKRLKEFNIDLLHSGESYDNLLKIFYIMENYPEVSLFIQTNPSFCCPALITEAMTRKIREFTGVPVLTLTYDGTSDRMNDVIVPYIRSARRDNSVPRPVS